MNRIHKTKYIVVLITTNGIKEAEKLSDILVKKKLAACVNIVPKIHSKYWWKGKIESSAESLMIIKTKTNLFKKLETTVRKHHSYTVPEIIAIPIVKGSKHYLFWIGDVTTNS
jgi:periplasmic divalent cation tolerance protein